MSGYKGKYNFPVSSGLTQDGTTDFPLVRAKDVEVSGERLTKFIPIILSQEEYNTIYEGYEDGVEITLENGQVIKYDPEQIYFVKRELPL